MKGGSKSGQTGLYEALKREILTLERAPDADLDEAALGEQYGISRTPVRDVLRRLAGEGCVDIRENRGARVIAMNHQRLGQQLRYRPPALQAGADAWNGG